MFASQKRIFAGKSNLSAEPFCPYLTNESGRMSLKRSLAKPSSYLGASPHAHLFLTGGKSRV